MEQILYIPGRERCPDTLRHIATKCGHCDDNGGGTGGGNGGEEKRKTGYLIRPVRKNGK